MKIRNCSKNTVYIDDLDKHIAYTGEPESINSEQIKISRCLRNFILSDLCEIIEYNKNERIEHSLFFLKNKQSNQEEPIQEHKEIVEKISTKPEPILHVKKQADLSNIEVKMHGLFFDTSGYAKVNRNLAMGLSKAGFKVKVDAKKSPNQLNENELKPIMHLQNTDISRNYISIDSIIPSFSELSGGKYKILYSTIESYTVPKQFIECCQMYSEIWITSEWSASILKNTDIKSPIYTVPTGVDQYLYKEDGPKYELPNVKDFVFISVFGWNYRKGNDVLLRAYLKEFSAKDNVTLLIASRYQGGRSQFHKRKIPEDVESIMTEFPNKDLPHIARYSKVVPEQEMPYLYRAADCFVLPSRGEGGCHRAGTQIITNEGLMDIESIDIDTKVLTHYGRFMPVTGTRCRHTNERMYTIKTSLNGEDIQLTGEHPVRVLCRNKTIKNGKKNKQAFSNENAEWKLPNEIDSGDYVLMPLNFCSSYDVDHIFVSDYVTNVKVKDGIIRRTVSRAKFTWEHKRSKNCKNMINADSDLLQMIGFYIAEGSSTKKGTVRFDFHDQETDYHSIVVNSINKHFNDTLKHIPDSQKDNRQHRYRLQCHNAVLGEFLRNICGHGAHNKHVPDFAWKLSKPQIFDLLYGIFGGDGSFYKPKTSCSPELALSTVSFQLANDVILLLRSIGISPCLKITKKRGYVVLIKGNQLNDMNGINGAFFNGAIKEKSVRTEKYVFIPVKEISYENYDGDVYNLEVEEDNSYTTNCFTVHNCLPPLEASLCGLPIIMTNCSGQQGYLREDNSYMIEIDHLEVADKGRFGIHYWDGQKFPCMRTNGVLKQVQNAMREVYENYEKAQARNKLLQKRILQNFTWDNTVAAASRRLQAISRKLGGK